jgi:hypothetical protein
MHSISRHPTPPPDENRALSRFGRSAVNTTSRATRRSLSRRVALHLSRRPAHDGDVDPQQLCRELDTDLRGHRPDGLVDIDRPRPHVSVLFGKKSCSLLHRSVTTNNGCVVGAIQRGEPPLRLANTPSDRHDDLPLIAYLAHPLRIVNQTPLCGCRSRPLFVPGTRTRSTGRRHHVTRSDNLLAELTPAEQLPGRTDQGGSRFHLAHDRAAAERLARQAGRGNGIARRTRHAGRMPTARGIPLTASTDPVCSFPVDDLDCSQHVTADRTHRSIRPDASTQPAIHDAPPASLPRHLNQPPASEPPQASYPTTHARHPRSEVPQHGP